MDDANFQREFHGVPVRGEESKQCPEYIIVSSILTDLICRRNHGSTTALPDPTATIESAKYKVDTLRSQTKTKTSHLGSVALRRGGAGRAWILVRSRLRDRPMGNMLAYSPDKAQKNWAPLVYPPPSLTS